MNQFEQFKNDCDMFSGDKRLFWAGRMAIVINWLEHSTPSSFTDCIDLLSSCKDAYNQLIYDKYEHTKDVENEQ
jgi:hypothetical protein